MLKKLCRKLSKNLFLVFTIGTCFTLTACMPQSATKEPLKGLSVGTLNKPISSSAVLVWANEAAVSAYSYDFQNYQTNLQKASQYFTQSGWQAYMTALTNSGNLEKVIKNQMVVSAVANGTPIILAQGELAGRYSWKIQMPLLVTYQGKNIYHQQHLIATLLIVRTSQIEGTRGLGIKQYIAIPQSTETGILKLKMHATDEDSNNNGDEENK